MNSINCHVTHVALGGPQSDMPALAQKGTKIYCFRGAFL